MKPSGERVRLLTARCTMNGDDPQEVLDKLVDAWLEAERTKPEAFELPKTGAGLPLDHPLYSKGKRGLGPFEVKIIRTK